MIAQNMRIFWCACDSCEATDTYVESTLDPGFTREDPFNIGYIPPSKTNAQCTIARSSPKGVICVYVMGMGPLKHRSHPWSMGQYTRAGTCALARSPKVYIF